MAELFFYDYWRSSAAYRVRIALNLKGLAYESIPVHLGKGEQRADAYHALNPQGLVPMLVADGARLTQSLAIIEYLDETHPRPPLLPLDAAGRAHARAMAQLVACDIHPLNNLRVLKYLSETLNIDDDAKHQWIARWIAEGLQALETLVCEYGGTFCFGGTVTVADICLIPQLYNARRFHCSLDGYPALVAVEARCNALPAFAAALPENQPDAPPPN